MINIVARIEIYHTRVTRMIRTTMYVLHGTHGTVRAFMVTWLMT